MRCPPQMPHRGPSRARIAILFLMWRYPCPTAAYRFSNTRGIAPGPPCGGPCESQSPSFENPRFQPIVSIIGSLSLSNSRVCATPSRLFEMAKALLLAKLGIFGKSLFGVPGACLRLTLAKLGISCSASSGPFSLVGAVVSSPTRTAAHGSRAYPRAAINALLAHLWIVEERRDGCNVPYIEQVAVR